jgi:uncharacterized protein (DUF2345 family)
MVSTKCKSVIYYRAIKNIKQGAELFDLYTNDAERHLTQDIDQFPQDDSTDEEEDDDEVNDPSVSSQDF